MRFPRHAIALWLTALALGGCTVQDGASGDAPPRPDNVPESAFWLGGPDGGVFVSIERRPGDPPRVYHGTIYDERGVTWYEGPLVVDPPDPPEVDLDDPEVFSGWSGDWLELRDGRALRAGPPRPERVPDEAFWAGSSLSEPGVFVLVERRPDDPPGRYHGTVYEIDGRIAYQGPLDLAPSDTPPLDLTDDFVTLWTGERLMLDDGRVLAPAPAEPPE